MRTQQKQRIEILGDPWVLKPKKGKRKVQGVPQAQAGPSQTPRGRENRQIQKCTNRTNLQKALRLALSSPNEVIAMLKGLKSTRTK